VQVVLLSLGLRPATFLLKQPDLILDLDFPLKVEQRVGLVVEGQDTVVLLLVEVVDSVGHLLVVQDLVVLQLLQLEVKLSVELLLLPQLRDRQLRVGLVVVELPPQVVLDLAEPLVEHLVVDSLLVVVLHKQVQHLDGQVVVEMSLEELMALLYRIGLRNT